MALLVKRLSEKNKCQNTRRVHYVKLNKYVSLGVCSQGFQTRPVFFGLPLSIVWELEEEEMRKGKRETKSVRIKPGDSFCRVFIKQRSINHTYH